MQIPTIGRVVHFYQNAAQAQPFAALVTCVHSATCINCAGFNHGNTQVGSTSVVFSEDPAFGMRWCWPPRV